MCAARAGAPTLQRVLILAGLSLGAFTIGTTEFATMGLLPLFARAFGVAPTVASRAVSAYALGVVIGAPVIAVLAARVSRGKLLVALMLWYAATNAGSALAPSFGALVLLRFLSGLPHGAYFGIAALVAASAADPARRAVAASRVLLGLTVATIVGVPVATVIGQLAGWRAGFALVTFGAVGAAALVGSARLPDADAVGRSPLAELGALRRPLVWLTLLTGSVGFGGLFAVYTYLGPILAEVTHAGPAALPVALALFGAGLTVGIMAAAAAADRALNATVVAVLIWSGATELFFAFVAGDLALVLVATFLIGSGGGLAAAIQVRLMDVAGDAQTLAASLMHSAFNIANALGPALAALLIDAGFGWRSTGVLGTALALGGLAVWLLSLALERREAGEGLRYG